MEIIGVSAVRGIVEAVWQQCAQAKGIGDDQGGLSAGDLGSELVRLTGTEADVPTGQRARAEATPDRMRKYALASGDDGAFGPARRSPE